MAMLVGGTEHGGLVFLVHGISDWTLYRGFDELGFDCGIVAVSKQFQDLPLLTRDCHDEHCGFWDYHLGVVSIVQYRDRGGLARSNAHGRDQMACSNFGVVDFGCTNQRIVFV